MKSVSYNQIQCLRGVAAVFVLFFHFAPQLGRYELGFLLPGIEKWGFWGVDVFFVLSGFVIALSSEKLLGVKDGIGFISKRALRVFLGYWPAFLLWLAVINFIGGTVDSGKLLASWFLFSGNMMDYILPVAWTLYYELFFYVLFFVLVVMVLPQWRPLVVQVLAVFVFAWSAMWLLLWPSDVMAGAQPVRGIISGYMIEFFAGVLIYQARGVLRGNTALALPLLMVVMILLIVGAQSQWFDKIELLRVGTYGFAAVAVVAIAICLEDLRYSKVLASIGDASYSLYITHFSVINVVVFLVSLSVGLESKLGMMLILLIPVFSIIFALVWYRLIERPLYDKAIKFLSLGGMKKVPKPMAGEAVGK